MNISISLAKYTSIKSYTFSWWDVDIHRHDGFKAYVQNQFTYSRWYLFLYSSGDKPVMRLKVLRKAFVSV
jgi:hypothetical protein